MTLLQTVYENLPLQLTGLSFLYLLLPLCLLVYYLVPGNLRSGVLLVATLGFYLLAEPRYLWLLAASVALDYLAVRLMGRRPVPAFRRACALGSVAKNLGVVLAAGIYSQVTGTPQILGIQIYTLCAMSAVVGIYRRGEGEKTCPVRFAVSCAFFPQLYAGPLPYYSGMEPQLRSPALDLRTVAVGFGQYIQGALKVSVIGSSLYALYRSVRRLGEADVTAVSSWLMVFALAYAVYFMMSGLSDLAQGLGRMFGLKLPRNFYYPYQARGMGDFFQRFNITVYRLIRDGLGFDLDKEPESVGEDCLHVLIVGMLMGIWFGLRINYLVWGIYLAVFVILERHWLRRVLEHTPTLLRRAINWAVVMSSFTIFSGDSLTQSFHTIHNMFRLNRFANESILYLLTSNWLLILISCLFATNAVSLVMNRFRRAAPQLSTLVLGAVDVALLAVLTALLIT